MGEFSVRARSGAHVRCEMALRDERGRPVALKEVASLVATLYDPEQGAVVNGRFRQDVLNVNGGSLHGSDGRFALWLTPADNQVLARGAREELHVLLLEVTLADGRTTRLHHRIRVTESAGVSLMLHKKDDLEVASDSPRSDDHVEARGERTVGRPKSCR